MTLLEHLENRLAIDNNRSDYFERLYYLKKFTVLMNRLENIIKNEYESRGGHFLKSLGCVVNIEPHPGFVDYGDIPRRVDPNCSIENITLYFVANWYCGKWEPKSIQVVVPVELAQNILIFGI